MMKKIMRLLGWDGVAAKEVEYRYVFVPPAGGVQFELVDIEKFGPEGLLVGYFGRRQEKAETFA